MTGTFAIALRVGRTAVLCLALALGATGLAAYSWIPSDLAGISQIATASYFDVLGARADTLSDDDTLDPAVGFLHRVAWEPQAPEPAGGTLVRSNGVAPHSLRVLGLPLVRGQPFGPDAPCPRSGRWA